MNFTTFDQSLPNAGWRRLGNLGCHLEAAQLLDQYRAHQKGKLLGWQDRNLLWHAGQMYALINMKDLALARLKASLSPDQKTADTLRWNTYAKGTIAFLEGNKIALQSAKDELTEVNKTTPNPNLKFLEAYLHCFGQPYSVAYSPDCLPADNNL